MVGLAQCKQLNSTVMKKSEILEILGNKVVSCYVEELILNNWLVVEVKSLEGHILYKLKDFIIMIVPKSKNTMLISFSSQVEID